MSTVIDLLKKYDLIPLASAQTIAANWNERKLKDFLQEYLEFVKSGSSKIIDDGKKRVFLDPLDSHLREVYLRHILITDQVVIVDPITPLHCPPRPYNQWIKELHGACHRLLNVADLIDAGFVITAPDPCHCGLNSKAYETAKAILEDEEARRPWYESAYVCKNENGRISVNGRMSSGKLYHIHLGPHLEMTGNFNHPAGLPKPGPGVHLDFKIQNQGPFKRMSTTHAMTSEGLAEKIKNFLLRPVSQHQGSLLMANQWADNRYTSVNPLTESVLRRGTDDITRNLKDSSLWIPPALEAVRLLGFDGNNFKAALEAKEKYSNEFREYLRAIENIFEQVQHVPADSSFIKEVKHLLSDKIESEKREIEREVTQKMRTIRTNIGFFGVMAITGSILICALPNQAAGIATMVGGAATTVIPSIEAALAINDQRRNPMYFLWKSRKHGVLKTD